jgi:beta-galactosidase
MNSQKNRTLSHRRAAPFTKYYYGAAYYPEHWDISCIEHDAQRMQKANFNVVRIAEFAWDMMEPQEGIFDFSFFDKVITVLQKYNIELFLCTPTAAPPRWLTQKHPELLRVNADGIAMQHGSRQHACHSNTIFRDYSKKITRAMAVHFANTPGIVGWQTDNEFNCHFSTCYCPDCQRDFIEFLKDRYSNIETLNQTWGTRFWTQTYGNFAQIQLPKIAKPTFCNPSHLLDHDRFISHSVTCFQHDQVEILRELNAHWLIFHNGRMDNLDYRGNFTEMLDVLGYDVYPMFHHNPLFRGPKHAFNCDSTRSFSGNFIVPEHQAGPGGQRTYIHNTPEPGEMRMMSWRSIAHGADALLYFRWRTCRFGAEEYWCGILDHDDIPRRRYHEAAVLGKELQDVGNMIIGSRVAVDVAIATGDYDVDHAHDSFHMGMPRPEKIAENIHRYLFDRGYSVGCVHPEDELKNIKLYFIPHWEIIKPEWIPVFEQFVADGGTLVIGARTGTKTIDNTIVNQTFPGLLAALTGITVAEYGRQNENDGRALFFQMNSGEVSQSSIWYEVLKLNNAEPLALWDNRHVAGEPAISQRNYGKGQVVYVGSYFTPELVEVLMPALIEMSSLTKPFPYLPKGLEVVIRDQAEYRLIILINGSEHTVDVAELPPGDIIIGDSSTKFTAYGVKVIQQIIKQY